MDNVTVTTNFQVLQVSVQYVQDDGLKEIQYIHTQY